MILAESAVATRDLLVAGTVMSALITQVLTESIALMCEKAVTPAT